VFSDFSVSISGHVGKLFQLIHSERPKACRQVLYKFKFIEAQYLMKIFPCSPRSVISRYCYTGTVHCMACTTISHIMGKATALVLRTLAFSSLSRECSMTLSTMLMITARARHAEVPERSRTTISRVTSKCPFLSGNLHKSMQHHDTKPKFPTFASN
jgi:hypothetical protein